MSNNNQQLILYLGIHGFPFGSAAVNYSSFICKSIQESGLPILIVNNRAVHTKNGVIKIDKEGLINGVRYRYTTLSPYKSKYFIIRNFEKIFGHLNEILLIIHFKIKRQLRAILLYLPTNSFWELIIYRIFSKLLFVPLVLIQTEYFSEIKRNVSKLKKVQDKLFDKYSYYFTDKYILISEFLIQKVFNNRKVKPYEKIPPLADPDLYNNLKDEPQKNFVFCASTAYMEVIYFVIDSFELLNDDIYKLILVVNGDLVNIKRLNQRISQSKKKNYILNLSNLPYESLLNCYLNAAALLIPLRPIAQDKARFPQKIAEYVMSGNPIITTNYGEVINYFEDNVSAIIAEHYDIYAFSKKMDYVIKYPNQSRNIGLKGKEIGMKYFNYKNYSQPLYDLFLDL